MRVRHAVPGDFPAIAGILNYYILNTDARYFEPEPLTTEARLPWLVRFKSHSRHQLLVAELNGEILGFCCAQPYRPERAYRQTVETSIYLSPQSTKQGVGSALYGVLFQALQGQSLHKALAAIVLPNEMSVALHHKFGFTEVGVFNEYGMKGERYISALWMEKRL